MRILNLQISKDKGCRLVENKDLGVDIILFEVDGHYVSTKPGVPDQLVATIPVDRRALVAAFLAL